MSVNYTTARLQTARESGGQARQRQSELTRAVTTATARARLKQCGDYLERIAARLYGAGRPIPAAEGGFLFREVCNRLAQEGYEITEWQLSQAAVSRGLWTATVTDVVQAFRPGLPECPEEDLPERSVRSCGPEGCERPTVTGRNCKTCRRRASRARERAAGGLA